MDTPQWDNTSTFALGSPVGLIAQSNHSFAAFQSAQVDGLFLARNLDFILREGSTIIELLPRYLNTLRPGTHTLTLQWSDDPYAVMSLDFSILPAPVPPRTGDGGPPLWLLLAVAALSGAGLWALLSKRRLRKS